MMSSDYYLRYCCNISAKVFQKTFCIYYHFINACVLIFKGPMQPISHFYFLSCTLLEQAALHNESSKRCIDFLKTRPCLQPSTKVLSEALLVRPHVNTWQFTLSLTSEGYRRGIVPLVTSQRADSHN